MSNIEPTIDDYLDRIAELNKLGYPDLDGACNICGVHPDALKALISDQVAKARIDEIMRMREAMTFTHMTPSIYAAERVKTLLGDE